MQLAKWLIALVSYAGAVGWYYRWDFARAWLYDQTFRVLESAELSKLAADHIIPIALFAFGTYMLLLNRPDSWRLPTLDELNLFDRTISLRDASIKLYEEMKGTDIGRWFDSHSGASADEILDGVSHHILEYAPLEVKRPPSTKWEPLPQDEKDQLMGRGGATGFSRIGSNSVKYPEVRLKRKDLKSLIRQYKADAKP
jgi:hypothetical protein